MILARNSFLRPWGVCRHKGHCRHQTCQGMALLPSCFSHISPELKGTWRILQELLSPLLGSEGICYRTAVKNIPAPRTVVSSPAEGALLEHCHSCSQDRDLELQRAWRCRGKAAHTQRSRHEQDAEGQLLWLQPSNTRPHLPATGGKGISRRCLSLLHTALVTHVEGPVLFCWL